MSIIIVDFGSQFTQLIARRIRECGTFCEIVPCTQQAELGSAQGIVLSGGPASVLGAGAPALDPTWYQHELPVLAICYGMQAVATGLGGRVHPAKSRQYGLAMMSIDADPGEVLGPVAGAGSHSVWMSHGDHVGEVPPGFRVVARSHGVIAAMVSQDGRITGLQFHPEVAHTDRGAEMVRAFVQQCGVENSWTMSSFLAEQREGLRAQIGSGRVICGLSGGVDSSVTAALLHDAVPDQLACIFVDNGLLREGERESVEAEFSELPLTVVDARERFLAALKGVVDPEAKRKAIGELFVRVFADASAEVGNAAFLAQGTLYPDVIESVSVRGPSATIKSHHNVGGLPEDMPFELVEPLRELFKDEVRELGLQLGLSAERVWRMPFPGPGLAIRCLGEVTAERLRTLRAADAIFRKELERCGHLAEVWQAFVVLLPVRSVGVMGDARTYEETAVLRAVTSVDGMTADWARLPHEFVAAVSNRIINEVPGINRVAMDVSSKPPATIEWE